MVACNTAIAFSQVEHHDTTRRAYPSTALCPILPAGRSGTTPCRKLGGQRWYQTRRPGRFPVSLSIVEAALGHMPRASSSVAWQSASHMGRVHGITGGTFNFVHVTKFDTTEGTPRTTILKRSASGSLCKCRGSGPLPVQPRARAWPGRPRAPPGSDAGQGGICRETEAQRLGGPSPLTLSLNGMCRPSDSHCGL
eukprot:2801580-Rhodomonas_salina.1